ncbi:hypothetical protein M1M96_02135 [Peptococcaceae bacterium]|nr:hypothetical protein [Peptococcaceae bacterium]
MNVIDETISIFFLLFTVGLIALLAIKGDAVDAIRFLLYIPLIVFGFAFFYCLGKKIGILTIKLISPTCTATLKALDWKQGWIHLISLIFGILTAIAIINLGIPTSMSLPKWSPIPEIPILFFISVFMGVYAVTILLGCIKVINKKIK